MGQTISGPRGPQGPRGPEGPPGKDAIINWGALTESQKTEIMESLRKFAELKGERGERGDQGPPGKDGISDPTQVAAKLISNPELSKNIVQQLPNVKDFNDSLINNLLDETKNYKDKLILSIYSKLDKNPTFLDDLSNYMTTNSKYQERLKGDPGSLADYNSVKQSLKVKTLWCADGDFCKLPDNYWNAAGTQTVGNVLGIQFNQDDENISFGDNSKGRDPNNGLSHRNFFGKNVDGSFKLPVDGPFLHGKDGGQLGSVQKTEGKNLQDWALKWNNSGNVSLKSNLDLQGSSSIRFGQGFNKEFNAGKITYGEFDGGENGSLNIIGGGKDGSGRRVRVWDMLQIGNWTINANDDNLRFYHNGQQKFVMHNNDASWDATSGYHVGLDRKYAVRSNRGGYLTDQGGWARDPKDWETMQFVKL